MPISRNEIKRLRGLQRKKERYLSGTYLMEGEKIALEMIHEHPEAILNLYALGSWLVQQPGLERLPEDRVHEVSIRELKAISRLRTPNRIVVEAPIPTPAFDPDLLEHNYAFFLDGLRDPGNMGTILRIADWFGFPYVLCGPGTVDPYNPKVVQSAMGALLRVQAIPMELEDLRRSCPKIPLLGADMQGENLFDYSMPTSGILMIGTESQGLSYNCLQRADALLHIPGRGGGAESLNAGVAAGIFAARAFAALSS